jgi:hypothetical protein
MTTYNTGNPVPSGNAYDRFDNSQTFDEVINSSLPATTTRTGKQIKTLAGQDQDFNQFLINSGFEPNHLTYVVGSSLQVDRPTQLIDYNGLAYRVKTPASFPVTLSGVWVTDSNLLVEVSDTSLRQSLASSDPDFGTAMVIGSVRYVDSYAALRLLPKTGTPKATVFAPGIAGDFYLDTADTTSAEIIGILIVAADGGRWKRADQSMPNLEWFEIVGGTTSDQTARIQSVIDLYPGKEIFAPALTYRVDGSLEVKAGTRMVMAKGAVFKRFSAHTASTTPILYLLDSFSECRGGKLLTENAAPSGVAVLGHKSSTDNRNAWWWRFCDMDVEGNGSGWGWVIVSGQVTYPMNANYFGTVQNVNTKNFDFGSLLFENANAHNFSNLQYWLCKNANIWVRGAYANNFSNIFFHGGAADGCIGIELVNKAVGAYTESEQNKFIGFTCETGGVNDKAFVIGTLCTGNVLIGTSNVAGGYTVGNADNNIQLSGYGSASYVSLPGEATKATGVLASVATVVTPVGQMSTGESGGYDITVFIYNSTNPSLNRVDKLLVSARNNSFAPSAIVTTASAFTATGVGGEPTSATYALDFTGGVASPALKVTITSVGGTGTFTVKSRMQRV